MSKTIAVVTNPASGGGKAAVRSAAAVRRLRERGARVIELVGASAAESTALAAEAAVSGVDAVVAAGGDGLISALLPALAQTGIPLGLVPAGTGNDLARELGVGRDPRVAADLILDGRVRDIDLGRARTADPHAQPRWFATVMSSGFDSKVTQRANAMRRPRGRMRYNLAILAEVAALRPIPYRVELDSGADSTAARVLDVDATLAAVGNARSYGGGMLMCPNARLDDGLLDITIVGAVGRMRLISLLPTVYRGTHIAIAGVSTFRARSVLLSLREQAGRISADADGEPVGTLPVTVESVPKALRVITS